MARIEKSLPERSVELAAEWVRARPHLQEFLNRELLPAARAARRAINGPYGTILPVTENYRALLKDDMIPVDTSVGPVTVELPRPAPIGTVLHFVDVSGALSENALTIAAQEGDLIAGEASLGVFIPYSAIDLIKADADLWVPRASAGDFLPLSNVLFADIGGNGVGANGSIGKPYNTLAALIAGLSAISSMTGRAGLLTPGDYGVVSHSSFSGQLKLSSLSGKRDVSAAFATTQTGSIVVRGFALGNSSSSGAWVLVDCETDEITGSAITASDSLLGGDLTAAGGTVALLRCTFDAAATLSGDLIIVDFDTFRAAVEAGVTFAGPVSILDANWTEVWWGGHMSIGGDSGYGFPFNSGADVSGNPTVDFPLAIIPSNDAILARVYVQLSDPLQTGEGGPETVTVKIYKDVSPWGSPTVVATVELAADGDDQVGYLDLLHEKAADARLYAEFTWNTSAATGALDAWVGVQYMPLRSLAFEI